MFLDIREISPGTPWQTALDTALATCTALLVIIGPKWLTAADQHGRRRLDDPADVLRNEVAEALRKGRRIVPVLVAGASMPAPADLPEDIQALAGLQAHDLTVRHWANDVARLVRILKPMIGGDAGAAAVPAKAKRHPALRLGIATWLVAIGGTFATLAFAPTADSTLHFIGRFYFPLLASLAAFVLAFVPRRPVSQTVVTSSQIDPKPHLLGVKVWANGVARPILLAALSLSSLIYALAVDFSVYYPSRLNNDLYYDVRGIERTLASLGRNWSAQFGIPENWANRLDDYDRDAIANIKKAWRRDGIPDVWPDEGSPREFFHGTGETTFHVERLSFLTYRIKDSQGAHTYYIDLPRQIRQEFVGSSALLRRGESSNFIRPNLLSLLASPTHIITPEYMQIFGRRSNRSPSEAQDFDHVLVAATKLTLLPIPSFGNTLFLWKSPKGDWLPIGYAVYHLPR